MVSSLSTFFLAMAMHPDVQTRAQQELDGIVGLEQMPDFTSRHALPYVDALVKEVIRWNPVAPLGQCEGLDDDMIDRRDFETGLFVVCRTATYGHRGRCLRWLLHSCWVYDNWKHVVRTTSHPPLEFTDSGGTGLSSMTKRSTLSRPNFVQNASFFPAA
jgi:hypothetical protein